MSKWNEWTGGSKSGACEVAIVGNRTKWGPGTVHAVNPDFPPNALDQLVPLCNKTGRYTGHVDKRRKITCRRCLAALDRQEG